MSVPISIGMLSTILFQVIDTYFVGQLGPEPLAALSFASTVYFLLVGLFIGFSVAVSIMVAKAFGAKELDKLKRILLLSLILSIFLTILISLLGIFSLDSLFGFLGADKNTLPHVAAYMNVLYLGMPILAYGIIGGAALRATGNVKSPEIVFGIAGIINAVLDYAFIFGTGPFPQLGIQGVALGTVISWIFIFLAMTVLLLRDKLLILPRFSSSFFELPIFKEIAQLGLPSIATQLVGPATLMFITFMLGKEGGEAVAAFGVAGRIETLMLIGVLGVSTAATPFIAQNLGAKQHLRIDEAIVFGGKASTYLGIFLFFFLIALAGPIAGLFSENAQIISYTKTYFYLVAISYAFYSLYLISSSIFNGLQLPVNSLKIILVKSFVFTLPLVLIGSLWGVEGIFAGLSLSNVLGGLYAGQQIRKQLKKVNSPLSKRNPWQDYQSDLHSLIKGLSSMLSRVKT